jgi:tetratricopeptide (TPR) repeat protein
MRTRRPIGPIRVDNSAHVGGFLVGLILGAGFTLARRRGGRARFAAALAYYLALSSASVGAALAVARPGVAARFGLPIVSPLRRLPIQAVLENRPEVPLPEDVYSARFATFVAEHAYDRAFPEVSNSVESDIGALYIIGHDLESAQVELEHAIAVRPNDGLARARLGAARAFQGDLAGAKADLERALALDPSLISARGQLAIVLADLGEMERARREAQLYLLRKPGENEKRLIELVKKIP